MPSSIGSSSPPGRPAGRPPAPACRGCGRTLTLVQHRRGLCDDPACRRRDIPFQMARRREFLLEEARSIARRVRPDLAARSIALLPANPDPAAPLQAGRRADFRAHLDRIIEDAAAQILAGTVAARESTASAHGVPDEVAAHPIVRDACGLCAGACCRQGGDTAFLEPATLLRLLRQRPDLDLQRLRTIYLDRLPDTAIAGSCVFHTASGCNLPRSFRSNICNQFLCKEIAGLVELRRNTGGRFLAVSASGSQVVQFAIVDRDGLTRVRLHSPATPTSRLDQDSDDTARACDSATS